MRYRLPIHAKVCTPLPFQERQELLERIYKLELTAPTFQHTYNVGGWRTGEDALGWNLPIVDKLRLEIIDGLAAIGFKNPKLRGWFIVNRNGAFHRWHQHAAKPWSGVYYIEPGYDSKTGACARTLFIADDELEGITPKRDLLVIFPGTLTHGVTTHMSDQPRVTLAFDAWQ